MSNYIEEKITEELGYISAIFMSQECKGTEIVMPSEKLIESKDRIMALFKEYKADLLLKCKEAVGEEAGESSFETGAEINAWNAHRSTTLQNLEHLTNLEK